MEEEHLEYRQARREDIGDLYRFFCYAIKNYFPYYSERAKEYITSVKFTERVIEHSLGKGFVQICIVEKSIVGMILALNKPSAGLWDLNWLVVDEKYRNRGVGSELIHNWEKEAVSRGVHCLISQTSNPEEISFYVSTGFIHFGTLPRGTYGNTKYKFYKATQEPSEDNYLRY